MRTAEITRKTKETEIKVSLVLEGSGRCESSTGVGFFDHMLDQLARHSRMDLVVTARGDLKIDAHHTVEDVGICIGQAFRDALGDRAGVVRYGHAVVPMDEALAEVAVDIGGRPFLLFEGDLPRGKVGQFDSDLVEEFLRALAVNARFTMHVILRKGQNLHHCIEAVFKALARSLDEAVSRDNRLTEVPSTKGTIENT